MSISNWDWYMHIVQDFGKICQSVQAIIGFHICMRQLLQWLKLEYLLCYVTKFNQIFKNQNFDYLAKYYIHGHQWLDWTIDLNLILVLYKQRDLCYRCYKGIQKNKDWNFIRAHTNFFQEDFFSSINNLLFKLNSRKSILTVIIVLWSIFKFIIHII